jgi:hypothetical protein
MPMQTMNLKRTATIVVVAGVLAAWFAGAATSKRPIPSPIVIPPQPIDARGIELANEVARLRDRLRPTTPPTRSRRNLFTFRAAGQPRAMPDVRTAPPATETLLPRITEPQLKLAGVAENAGPDGPDRTAIISGDGQLFMVKEGDSLTARYRVVRISPDAVELADAETGTIRRLAMR